jgi:hypothetical protein
VRRIGLFDAALARFGVRALYPEDEAAMLATIRQIKSGGTGAGNRDPLRAASKALAAGRSGADDRLHRVFACLPMPLRTRVTSFDTLDELVAAIKAFAVGEGQCGTDSTSEPDKHQDPTEETIMSLKLKQILLGAAAALLAGPALAEKIIIGHFGNPTPCNFCRPPTELAEATGWEIEWRKFGAGTDVIAAMASGDVVLSELGSSPSRHRGQLGRRDRVDRLFRCAWQSGIADCAQ